MSFLWYFPHYPVTHPYQPSEVCVVFDCAPKSKDMCLNDALMQEPNQTNTLNSVLTRFRKERVVLVGNIKSIFHQVQVNPKDTWALRFLWWSEGTWMMNQRNTT